MPTGPEYSVGVVLKDQRNYSAIMTVAEHIPTKAVHNYSNRRKAYKKWASPTALHPNPDSGFGNPIPLASPSHKDAIGHNCSSFIAFLRQTFVIIY
jgi:hypothetical protein